MISCPRCGSTKVVEARDTIRVDQWETLHATHRCEEERCRTPFRYDPPLQSVATATHEGVER